jgi:hypothetical protein
MPSGNDSEQALVSRLQQLVREHSQAKIARETQSTPSTVSRYLAGMKVPAEFCARLVSRLGVNPAWLLSGEGAVYLADVKAATAHQSRDMLELVQAMSAISRAKLGALMGKQDRKSLRELGDAIAAFERIRDELSEKTRGFLADILQQFRVAVEKRDYAQAEYLCTVARQAARLCYDEQLHRGLDHYESELRSSQRKDESALKLQRAAILKYLVVAEPDELALAEIRHHVSYALRTGRIEQARRTAKAALTMAEGLRHDEEYDYQLHALGLSLGACHCLLGDVREGAAIVFSAANRMGPANEVYYHADVILAELFLGLRDIDSVFSEHEAKVRQGKAEVVQAGHSTLMSFAFLLGGNAFIKQALDFYDAHAEFTGRLGAVIPGYAKALLTIGKKGAVGYRDYLAGDAHKERLRSESPVDHFRAHATACQLARAGGLTAFAREAFFETEALLEKLPRQFQIPVLQLAVHHKNALELFTGAKGREGELALRGRRWLAEHIARGFGGFRPLLA